MAIDGLNREQAFDFINEMTSARNLLAYGIKSLRDAPFIETTLDPILSLLSIGVEKHLKLILGVIGIDDTGGWPPFNAMKGHDIVAMYDRVMIAIRARTIDKSQFVQDQVAGVDADPVVPALMAVLDRYAREGRFYNLDRLAERTQKDDPPWSYWSKVELIALTDPAVQGRHTVAMADISNQDAWNEFHAALQGRVADALERFWTMVCWVGKNHALGTTGRTLAFEVDQSTVGRQRSSEM